MKRRIYTFLFTIFSLFIFYSCSIGISDRDSDERNLTDSVRLKVFCDYDKKGARTLFPTCITDSDISKAVLRAYLIDPSGNVVSSTSLNKSWTGSNVLNQIRDANDIYISTGTFKFILPVVRPGGVLTKNVERDLGNSNTSSPFIARLNKSSQ